MKQINVTKSYLPSFEEYSQEIQSIWQSSWLTNMGQKHIALEQTLHTFLGTENICLYSNGHLALESMLRVLGLQGEVITSPFTFASTTHAIVRAGCIPVFCDIHADDYTIDETKIEALITPRTCAILPIHVYGNICRHEALEAIAKKYNIPLLYDAAHSFGEVYKGKSTALLGDACIFSFHATKVFHTIEGGAICFQNPALKQAFDLEKNFGIPNAEEVVSVGGNAKMNEFQAAMGLCNMRHIGEIIAKRKALAERYYMQLQNETVQLCIPPAHVQSNYSYMPVLFPQGMRDRVFTHLKNHNIYARKYFYPLCNSFACYEDTSAQTPIALDISQRILTLPLYPDLELADVDRICTHIKELLHDRH